MLGGLGRGEQVSQTPVALLSFGFRLVSLLKVGQCCSFLGTELRFTYLERLRRWFRDIFLLISGSRGKWWRGCFFREVFFLPLKLGLATANLLAEIIIDFLEGFGSLVRLLLFPFDLLDKPFDATDHYKEDQEDNLAVEFHLNKGRGVEERYSDAMLFSIFCITTCDGITHAGIRGYILVFDKVHDAEVAAAEGFGHRHRDFGFGFDHLGAHFLGAG